MTNKTVVTYDTSKEHFFIGAVAFVHPIDHPSELVSNTKLIRTSRVVRHMVNGEFETLNTIYVPNTPLTPFIDKV